MYNFDAYGIPLQLDGDGGDALWKLGVRRALLKFLSLKGADISAEPFSDIDNYRVALARLSNARSTIYRRYWTDNWWADPFQVTRDQLKTNFIALALDYDDMILKWRFDSIFAALKEAGQYPSGDILGPELDMIQIRATQSSKNRWKLPFLDTYLMGETLIRIGLLPVWDADRRRLNWDRSNDVSDDISHCLFLMYCNLVWPTSVSKKALELYLKYRPSVQGWCSPDQGFNVDSAWLWYFRHETGNSPEIAKLFLRARLLYWKDAV